MLLYCAFSFATCLANFSALRRDKLQERSRCLVKRAICWSSVTSPKVNISHNIYTALYFVQRFLQHSKRCEVRLFQGVLHQSLKLECGHFEDQTQVRENHWGGGGTPYNGLYGEAPPVRVTFFKHSVISLGKRSKKDAFYGCEKAQKTFWFCDLFIFYRQCVYSS